MHSIKKFGRYFNLIAFLTLISCSQTKEQKVDQLFEAYRGENIPGAAVMIIDHGTPVLTKTYGMANLEEKIPVSSQTNFRLASLTKQFTAMCIMMLKERGKLDYSTTLTQIFPEFPSYGKTISILNILQHTSGLLAYEDLVPDTSKIQVLDKDVLALMMQQDSTYFEPGSAYRYSNTGYAVLAEVVKKISGRSFARFLRQNIFEPLGMKNTVAYEKGISAVPNRAYGYDVQGDSVSSGDQSTYSAVLGDGGIYSSLEDLFKWDQALYTDSLVTKESLRRAFTPYLERYGFGWRIDTYKNHRRIHHTGSTSGFRNVIQRFPDDELTIIILTNRKEPGVAPLAEKLADMYLVGQAD